MVNILNEEFLVALHLKNRQTPTNTPSRFFIHNIEKSEFRFHQKSIPQNSRKWFVPSLERWIWPAGIFKFDFLRSHAREIATTIISHNDHFGAAKALGPFNIDTRSSCNRTIPTSVQPYLIKVTLDKLHVRLRNSPT